MRRAQSPQARAGSWPLALEAIAVAGRWKLAVELHGERVLTACRPLTPFPRARLLAASALSRGR